MLKVLSQKSYLDLQNDYNTLPSISPQEQKKLFQKMERYPENSQKIRNEIVEKNMGLINFWVGRMKRSHLIPISGLEIEDIYQAGVIGLMRAIDKFKWRKGYRFSTYAIPWIKQAITRTIYSQSNIISIPIHKTELITRYRRTKRELYQELQRPPSILEIAIRMDVDTAKIDCLEEIKDPLSLEAPFHKEDENNTLIDVLEDKKIIHPLVKLAREDLKKELARALSFLNPRERKILIMRFWAEDGKGYTLNEVGRVIGITRERVRQIQKIAIEKLRQNSQLRELLK